MTDSAMGEGHHFNRRASDGNVAALAVRVKALEDRMDVFDHELKRNTTELLANTRLTEEIHGNTEAIIEAVQGAKKLWDFLNRWGGRFKRWSYSTAKYVAVIAGAFTAVAAAIKGYADINVLEVIRAWWHK